MEQLGGETGALSGKTAAGAERLELVADSGDIRNIVAVTAESGSSAVALELDGLYIDSGAVHH